MSPEEKKVRQQAEVDANFEYFQKFMESKDVNPRRYGTFALIKAQDIKGFFSTWSDAKLAGRLLYGDKDEPYSIQEVTDRVVDLGYHSRAVA